MAIIGAQAFENSMINALAVSDPQLNTALGTPVRKIITAVAQEMAGYNVDVNTTTTLYSLDSVSGTELDYLVGQFGFSRQEARAGRGSITIRRDNGDSLLQIPYGSQFYRQATSTTPNVVFQTTAYQELAEGVLEAEIAVVSTVAGVIGNVPANTITYSTTQVGFVSVTNEAPTSGGRDAETDDQLRQRFLQTVFRNVSGTSDQMLGLALAHEKVNKANLIGQESRYSEITQVYKDGDLTQAKPSSEQWGLDVDHVLDADRRYWVRLTDTSELLSIGDYDVNYDGSVITFHPREATEVIGPIVKGGVFYLKHKSLVSYTMFNNETNNAAVESTYVVDKDDGTVTIPTSANVVEGITYTISYKYNFIAEGDYVTIEMDYFSKHNRGGIKTVDLYVDSLSQEKVNDVQYVDFSKVITSTSMGNWRRDDGTAPTLNHLFIPLSYQPLFGSTGYVNMGTSIVLVEGKHFRMLYDVTKDAGSCRGMDAVELLATIGNNELHWENDTSAPTISDDTPVNVPYLYNSTIERVQNLIDDQRVVTMDVQVHEANHRYCVIYLTLMYTTFPRDNVVEQVKDNLMAWAEALPFGYTIQFSDIETIAANTAGVDNVRVATEEDAGGTLSEYHSAAGIAPKAYGIIELERDNKTYKAQHKGDFRLSQADVFEITDVVVYSRSQQNWG